MSDYQCRRHGDPLCDCDGPIDALNSRLAATEAKLQRAVEGLKESHALALRLYEAVQNGAGCCGKHIGRGSRIRQVADELERRLASLDREGE